MSDDKPKLRLPSLVKQRRHMRAVRALAMEDAVCANEDEPGATAMGKCPATEEGGG